MSHNTTCRKSIALQAWDRFLFEAVLLRLGMSAFAKGRSNLFTQQLPLRAKPTRTRIPAHRPRSGLPRSKNTWLPPEMVLRLASPAVRRVLLLVPFEGWGGRGRSHQVLTSRSRA